MFNEGRISFMFIFIIISKKINASLNFLVLGLCPVKWDIFAMAIKQAIPLQGTKELRNWGSSCFDQQGQKSANDI